MGWDKHSKQDRKIMHHNKHERETAERVASLLTIGGRNNGNVAKQSGLSRASVPFCWPRIAHNMSPQILAFMFQAIRANFRTKSSPKAAICA
jgi:hypothetical protein